MADQMTKRCSDLSQLAVVIPCHNEEHTILQVVDSLPKGLGQWLVVDNGSSASCRELLQEHLAADRLLIVEEPLGVVRWSGFSGQVPSLTLRRGTAPERGSHR